MKIRVRSISLALAIFAIPFFLISSLAAQDAHFHNAPASSAHLQNPYVRQPAAVAAGSKLYATNCAACHGANGQGTGNIPPISEGPTQTVPDGEVFWFITTGSVKNGMPAWASLPEEQRWQIVTFLKSLKNSKTAEKSEPCFSCCSARPYERPAAATTFTDFRFEQPGKTSQDHAAGSSCTLRQRHLQQQPEVGYSPRRCLAQRSRRLYRAAVRHGA